MKPHIFFCFLLVFLAAIASGAMKLFPELSLSTKRKEIETKTGNRIAILYDDNKIEIYRRHPKQYMGELSLLQEISCDSVTFPIISDIEFSNDCRHLIILAGDKEFIISVGNWHKVRKVIDTLDSHANTLYYCIRFGKKRHNYITWSAAPGGVFDVHIWNEECQITAHMRFAPQSDNPHTVIANFRIESNFTIYSESCLNFRQLTAAFIISKRTTIKIKKMYFNAHDQCIIKGFDNNGKEVFEARDARTGNLF
jgi:hypothetical protein